MSNRYQTVSIESRSQYHPPLLPTTKIYLLCNASNLLTTIDALEDIEPPVYPSLVSVVQAISTLRQGRKKRDLRNSDSRGTKVKALEDSIANLDSQQSAVVVETHEGVQRICGLAGSGKTIVLALRRNERRKSRPALRQQNEFV